MRLLNHISILSKLLNADLSIMNKINKPYPLFKGQMRGGWAEKIPFLIN